MADEIFDNQALYAACLNDGSDVQAAAYESLWAELHRIAYWMLRERSDADAMASDCAQQALIKIHNSVAQCHDPAAFRPWTARVLHRVVFDELRRPEHTRTGPIPEDDDYIVQLAVPG